MLLPLSCSTLLLAPALITLLEPAKLIVSWPAPVVIRLLRCAAWIVSVPPVALATSLLPPTKVMWLPDVEEEPSTGRKRNAAVKHVKPARSWKDRHRRVTSVLRRVTSVLARLAGRMMRQENKGGPQSQLTVGSNRRFDTLA